MVSEINKLDSILGQNWALLPMQAMWLMGLLLFMIQVQVKKL